MTLLISSSFVQLGLVLAALALVHLSLRTRKAQPKIPRLPSPKGVPILGSIPDLPLIGPWFKWYQWSQELGPLYEVHLGADSIVIAGSQDVVSDLYGARSAKYADRPPLFGLEDSRGVETNQAGILPFLAAGHRHLLLRKAASRLLAEDRTQHYHGQPILEARRLIYRLMQAESSERAWLDIIPDALDRIVSRLAWGSPDGASRQRELVVEMLCAASPATNIVNAMTFLAKLPHAISPWKRAERKRRAKHDQWWLDQLKLVEERMDNGVAGPSWARTLLEDMRSPESDSSMHKIIDSREQVAALLGMLVAMGSFSTASLSRNTARMMAAYPDWTQRVHDELDRVVGADRLPEVADIPRLPTLRAFLRETIRIHPPIPTGVPRALAGDEDDVYAGHTIPHSRPIFACDYILARDAAVYPDPFAFNPARWLSPEYATTTFHPDLTQHPTLVGAPLFGTGRRVCLGQDLATTAATIVVAHLFWAFSVAARDPQAAFGTNLGPHETWGGMQVPQRPEHSILLVPTVPCDLRFRVRSEARRHAIAAAYEASRDADALRALGSVTCE